MVSASLSAHKSTDVTIAWVRLAWRAQPRLDGQKEALELNLTLVHVRALEGPTFKSNLAPRRSAWLPVE